MTSEEKMKVIQMLDPEASVEEARPGQWLVRLHSVVVAYPTGLGHTVWHGASREDAISRAFAELTGAIPGGVIDLGHRQVRWDGTSFVDARPTGGE